jgi:hypothetical protein
MKRKVSMRVVPSVRHCCFYSARIWIERRVWKRPYRASAGTLSCGLDVFYQKIDVAQKTKPLISALGSGQQAGRG